MFQNEINCGDSTIKKHDVKIVHGKCNLRFSNTTNMVGPIMGERLFC